MMETRLPNCPGIKHGATLAGLAAGLWLTAASGAPPLLGVPRVQRPPRIDGRLDDPAWRDSSAAAGFTRLGERAPALEPTRFRAVHDGSTLYLAVVCSESALIPAEQRAEQVKRKRRPRDGNVFADDVVEIFLDPRNGRPYAHLAVNAAGSRYDARGKDASWNLAWRAVVALGNGRWLVEAAIPLAPILGHAPGRWERIGFNLAREEKPRRELSSWAPLDSGFHDPGGFGTLLLAPELLPAAAVETGIETGAACVFPVRLRSPQGKRSVRFEAVAAAGHGRAGKGNVEVLGALQLTASPGRPATGRLRVRPGSHRSVAVRASAAAGRLFFRTPPQPLAGGGLATWRAEFAMPGGKLTLAVDGRVVRRSDGRGRLNAAVSLARGAHLVVLSAEGNGTVSGALRFGDLRLELGPAWRRRRAKAGEPLPAGIRAAAAWPAAVDLRVRRGIARFARAIAVGGKSRTPLAPNQRLAQFPRGMPELVYPNLDPPALDLPGPYEAVVQLPPGFSFIAADGRAGQHFDSTKSAAGPSGLRLVLRTPFLGRSGFEISSRFSDSENTTTGYVPTISFGGSHGWLVRKARVQTPPGSVGLRPLFIKWQNRGAVGECWIDDVAVRDAGSGRLLFRRTFEEPGWTAKPHVAVLPGGGHAARILGKAAATGRQQALWLVEKPIPVTPGSVLEVSCRAQCRGVHSRDVAAHAALVLRSDAAADTEAHAWVSYRIAGGFLVQTPRVFTVRTLPPLLGIRPKRIRIVPCYYSDRFEAAASKALAENIDRSGITGIYGSRNHLVAKYVRHRLHWILSLPWHPFAAGKLGYGPKDFPSAQAAVSYAGRRLPGQACPTWLLSPEGRARFSYLGDWIAKRFRASGGYDEIDWDYETPVVDPPTFCFCPRCLAAFAKQVGADPAHLNAETVVSRYRKAWVAFRCRQNAEIAGLLAAQVRRAAPGVEFSVYSGYQTRHTREHYGVDWRFMADSVDLGIAGYGAPPAQVRRTAAVLAGKGKRFMGGEMYFLSIDNPRGTWHPETWKVRLVRQTIESGGLGCLIWWLPVMDGGAFYQTSRAAALLAAIEDFVTSGRRAERSVQVRRGPANQVVALEKDRRRCLLFFNPTPRPLVFGIRVQGRFREVRETGAPGGALGPEVRVPAREVRAFIEVAPGDGRRK